MGLTFVDYFTLMLHSKSNSETCSPFSLTPTDFIQKVCPSPVAMVCEMAWVIKWPSLQVKVILPVAFFVKLPLLLATNIEIFLPDFLICIITKAPVVSSAAIAWTAKYMELKGFWLNQRCFTVTTHCCSEIAFTLTPDQNAEGNLKNKKVFNFEGENSISTWFYCKSTKKTWV